MPVTGLLARFVGVGGEPDDLARYFVVDHSTAWTRCVGPEPANKVSPSRKRPKLRDAEVTHVQESSDSGVKTWLLNNPPWLGEKGRIALAQGRVKVRCHKMGLPSLELGSLRSTFLASLAECTCDLLDSMFMDDKVRGPQSYFPSIEAKYGYPVMHWFEILQAHRDKPHMEMVSVLKGDHGLGHGHANALVAYFRAHEGRN